MARFAVGLSLVHLQSFNSIFKTDCRKECGLAVRRLSFLFALPLCLVGIGSAQVDPSAGIQMFSTRENNVDLATSSITVNFPIRSKTGKIPVSFSLVGNYHVYGETILGIHFLNVAAALQPQLQAHDYGYSIKYTNQQTTECNGVQNDHIFYDYVIIDQTGASHPLPTTIKTDNDGCFTWPTTPQTTTDGSGLTATNAGTIYDKSGVEYATGGTLTDSDGAAISSSTSGNTATYTDTLGATFLTATVYSHPALSTSDTYVYTDASGNNQTYTVAYKEYTLRSNFGCATLGYVYPDYNDSSAPAYLPYTITDPNGAVTTLTYEATPGVSGAPYGAYTTGRIASITFGSGGSITYAYSQNGDSQGQNGMDCVTFVVPKLTVTVNDNNGNSSPYIYMNSDTGAASPNNFTVTKTDPGSNETLFNFSGEYQTQAKYYQGTGTVLKTAITCYGVSGAAPPSRANCPTPTTTPSLPITETDVYTSLGSSSYNEVRTTFDATYGNVTYAGAYDFGASAVTSQNLISYGSWNGSACVAVGNYINDKPCQTSTQDSAGNTYAATDFAYNQKGHPTNIGKWTGASTAWLVTYPSWNSNGTMSQVKDPAGNITTFGYAPTGSGGCNGLLLTSTTYPLSPVGSDSQTWDCNGGVRTSYQDVNGNPTTYNYTANGADPLYRIKEVTPPIESPTTYTYHTGALPWYAATTQLIWGSSYAYHQVNLDGLGRAVGTTDTDPNSSTNYRYVTTTYNNLGQIASVTNPYFTTSDSTYGSTAYNYDALGRVADVGSTPAITLPDGNINHIVYTNRAKLVTDGAGIQKAYQPDGLGRLQYVCDGIGATTQANNANPSTCTNVDGSPSGFLATYGYDASNNLTSASVGAYTGYSGQTRSFTYDGLSRMLTSTNPESGTVTNVYDTGSAGDLFTTTLPKPNASSGTVTACYGSWTGSSCTSSGWDAMHRLTYVSFSDGSPSIGYGYDSSNVWGTPVSNPKGRMVLANHATQGAALFSYDTGGRMINTWQCTPINCGTSSYPLSYAYNYVSQPQATTDAAGNTFSKAYNAAGEVTSLQSSKTGTNYPQYLLNNISYNALGEVASATYGDGIVRTNTYDRMGRPTEIQDGTTPTYRLYLTYYGNGSVKTFNDTVSGAYTYTYDAFNRLVSSTNTAQSYSWTYDQFGNRWHQDKTAGTGYTVDLSFNNSNRITTSGYSYDAAGNLLKDGSACNPCWQYDDNGNLVSSAYGSSAASYSYDALGRRVEKVSGTTTYDFVLDGSNPLDEYQGSSWPTTWTRTTDGAFTYANSTTYFNRTDNLGTPRVSTDYTGTVRRTETMGPWGDGFTESFTGLDFTGFAGGVWDQENNGDHFGAREYSKTLGRWLQPDPAGLAAVDPSNPQSWNRYAYVTNNPVSMTDPTGLDPDGGGGDDSGGGTGGEYNGSFGGTCLMCGTSNYGQLLVKQALSFFGIGSFYDIPGNSGFGSNGAQQEARYVSIMNTGWDPVLGVDWNDPNRYLSEAQGQYDRLNGNLAQFGGLASANPTTCDVNGGHCNFAFTCDDWSVCGPLSGQRDQRFDNGIHVECASGQPCSPGDSLVVHDDTVSPWTGSFTFGAILTGNFWEHGFVDLIGGTFFVGAFPQ